MTVHLTHPMAVSRPQQLVADNREHGTSGNAWRDEFLAERNPQEIARLQALARQSGIELSGGTILRPQLITQSVTGIDRETSANLAGVLTYYFPYFCFVEKVTATVRGIQLDPDLAPDAFFVGNDNISPQDYIEGQLERTTREQIMTARIPLSEWTGTGEAEYVWGILPFVTMNETLTVPWNVVDDVLSIEKFTLTFHVRRFPIEGL